MDYKVIFTENAMEDMDSIVEYLLFHLRNKQAACHFIDSVENGKFVLSNSAESFQLCLNSRLRSKGYRRLNLDKTKYFLLYRTENSTVLWMVFIINSKITKIKLNNSSTRRVTLVFSSYSFYSTIERSLIAYLIKEKNRSSIF